MTAVPGLGSARVTAQRHDRPSARMVLDLDVALDLFLAEHLRAELERGAPVHVELRLPRLGWTTDAALVALHQRRVAEERRRRLEELAAIAGTRHDQVVVSVHRPRWTETAGRRLAGLLAGRSGAARVATSRLDPTGDADPGPGRGTRPG